MVLNPTINEPRDLLQRGIRRTTFCDDVVIFTVASDASERDVLQAFVRVVQGARTPRMLWDLRARRLAAVPVEELRAQVARMVQMASPARARGRAAIVVSTAADYDAARMLMAFATEQGYGLDFNVFHDDRTALDWLFGRS